MKPLSIKSNEAVMFRHDVGRSRVAPRRAYILLVVLGLAVVVTGMGLTFLESYSMVIPDAKNRAAAARANYVAESGVAIAKRFLMYPPQGVPQNSYYTGDSALAVDASSDYASVAVARSDTWTPPQTDLNLYRITSVGVVRDASKGEVLAKRSLVTEVVVSPQRKWQIPYALLDRDVLNVISGVNVTGDIHANGNVDLHYGSYYSGSVSSTGSIRSELVLNIFTNSCVNAKHFCNAAAFVIPTGQASKYENYVLNGRYYSAYVYGSSTMSQPNAAVINSMEMSSTNPGRFVIYKGGNLRMRANSGSVSLNGSLIVPNGDLEFFDAGTYVINAVEGFPALILSQNLRFSSDNVSVVVNGPVLCVGDIDLGNRRNASLEIKGPLIKTGSFANLRTGSDIAKIEIKQSIPSTFWDLESDPLPITVLSWKEQ